jgi:glycosyltransferase involved in cell wall biosynthesis
MATDTLPLSVAIITKNEEERLADCLASVAMAAEVVVVDSGSIDRTVEIAKMFGAQVYHEEWQGFGRQKQKAIDYCTQPWVLVLDADERVSPELVAEIQEVIGGASPAAAWSMPRKNYFCGHWLRHAGWWPDRVVRLFRRGTGKMSDRMVHESVMVTGVVAEFHSPLVHFTHRDLAQTLEKINHYSTAGAEELRRRGVQGSVSKAIFRAGWAFISSYFLRAGLLDGVPGLVQALTNAVNTLFKYLKLWELQQQGSLPGDRPGQGGV